MARKAVLIALGLALAPLLCGCGDSVRVGEKNNGNTVMIAVGDTLAVALLCSPSLGYSWEIKRIDETRIEVVGEPKFKPAERAGPSGDMVFRFRAIASGESTLQLRYVRPPQARRRRERTFRIIVIVK